MTSFGIYEIKTRVLEAPAQPVSAFRDARKGRAKTALDRCVFHVAFPMGRV